MKIRRGWRSRKKTTTSPGRAPVVRAVTAAAGVLRGRRAWAAGGAAGVVLGLTGAWLLIDGEGGAQADAPDPRARQYQDVDACLLTGEKGVGQGTLAASVWEGMQTVSLETRARVTYVPVMGTQSEAGAQPVLNGLIQRQCDVVVAVGASQVQVTKAAAGAHPAVRFLVVDEAPGAKAERAGNLAVARPGGALQETVAETIRQAVRASDG
ncbi:BMP family ABC transporter substrate-binding protein [Streptomyces sp. NPDC057611]|uniref:BMP family ABC transporter substrate-binding protein n=1 Tax=Streptomyces sp. NPDC057611 TaxID=3346182 RepID=UPI0036BE3874